MKTTYNPSFKIRKYTVRKYKDRIRVYSSTQFEDRTE